MMNKNLSASVTFKKGGNAWMDLQTTTKPTVTFSRNSKAMIGAILKLNKVFREIIGWHYTANDLLNPIICPSRRF